MIPTPLRDACRRAWRRFASSAQVVADQKLLVALELYGAYFTEVSGNARFLSLVMALDPGRPASTVGLYDPVSLPACNESRAAA